MISPLLDKTLSGVPHADRNLKFIIISKIKLNKIKILNSFIFVKNYISIIRGPTVWERLKTRRDRKLKWNLAQLNITIVKRSIN